MIEIPSKMGTQNTGQKPNSVPKDEKPISQYLHIRPSTIRHRKLMALAHELGCSWQDIARIAIDTYLSQNFPKQV